MNILSLDLGESMGWATFDGTKIKSGVQSLKNSEFDGGDIRFLRFKRFLRSHKNLDLVSYEGVRAHSGGAVIASHIYGAYMGVLKSELEELNVPYCGYGVTTIKKFWTGKGNASKDVMVKVARTKGFNPATHDEADALAILHLTISEYFID